MEGQGVVNLWEGAASLTETVVRQFIEQNLPVRVTRAPIFSFWIIGFKCSVCRIDLLSALPSSSLCAPLTLFSLLGFFFLCINKKNINRENKLWDNYPMKSSVSSTLSHKQTKMFSMLTSFHGFWLVITVYFSLLGSLYNRSSRIMEPHTVCNGIYRSWKNLKTQQKRLLQVWESTDSLWDLES